MLRTFHFFLNIIEYFYKKKINQILKKNLPKKINIFFDIGAHHGETTLEMLSNFSIKDTYLFEPGLDNFKTLSKKISKNSNCNIKLFNFALGDENKFAIINEVLESSSSTLNSIDTTTKYFKRKKKILNLFSNSAEIKKNKIEIRSFNEFIHQQKIQKIDFIKIDTEGYEYKILNNIEKYLKNIGVIQFEHHYDLMIIKNYKFRQINDLLIRNNFKQIFKSRMRFRKSFEYIYINRDYKFD